jgi:DNA-3-methyladenine glycosylase
MKPGDYCSGPARLTQALAINKECNNIDLTSALSGLYLEDFQTIPEQAVLRTPRIGIQYAGEPWIKLPWRFVISEPYQFTSTGEK